MAEVFKNSTDEKPVKETELEAALYELNPMDTPVDIDQKSKDLDPQTKENYKKLQDRVLTLQEMQDLAFTINWQKITVNGKELTITCEVINNGKHNSILLLVGDEALWNTLNMSQVLWRNKTKDPYIIKWTDIRYWYKDPNDPLQKNPYRYKEWGQEKSIHYQWENKVELDEANSKLFQDMFNAVVDKMSKLDTQK